jgi:DNA helicase-2/ATP-dependent DNA helicase PcrA
VVVHEAYDEEDEAVFVAEEIRGLTSEKRKTENGKREGRDEQALGDSESVSGYRDIAVMYRTNAQSRPVEEALVRRGIPYRLVGGTRFYERREVKDLLAYLRLLQNPFDSVALMRVINVPHRGIGDRTLSELTRWSREKEIPPYSALQLVADTERDSPEGPPTSAHPFQKRTVGNLLRFLGMLNELIALAKTESLSDVLDAVIDRTDYKPHIMDEPDGEERWDNVQELRAVVLQYDELKPEHALASFLEDVALITDVDTYDEKSDSVTLITLHAAKGLEFPVVFMVGMEEGLLPHMRSMESGSPEQMEEERRLCYVGMTRAKRHLYLVRAFRRAFSGHNPPSRFLADIPPELAAQSQRAPQREMFSRRHQYATAPGHATAASLATMGVSVERTVAGAEEPPLEAFSAGEKVRHPKFGEGIVVSCEPAGGDYQVVVAFQGEAGIKKLLLSFAPLERVG